MTVDPFQDLARAVLHLDGARAFDADPEVRELTKPEKDKDEKAANKNESKADAKRTDKAEDNPKDVKPKNSQKTGQTGLKKNLEKDVSLGIGEIRGLGGMVAFEIIQPGTSHTPDADITKALTTRAAELGLILLSCGVYANTIRVLVPLTVEDEILEEDNGGTEN